MTSGAGDDETRLGTVELLPGTGRGGRLVRPVLAVAVVVIDLIEGDEVTAVKAFEVHGGVVERGVLRPHPVRPYCHASSQY